MRAAQMAVVQRLQDAPQVPAQAVVQALPGDGQWIQQVLQAVVSARGHTHTRTHSSKNTAVSSCICDTYDSCLPVAVELQQVEAKIIQWPFIPNILFLFQAILLHVWGQRGAGVLPVLTEALEKQGRSVEESAGFTCHPDAHATHLESILVFGEGVGHRRRRRQHEPEVDSQGAFPVQLGADVDD